MSILKRVNCSILVLFLSISYATCQNLNYTLDGTHKTIESVIEDLEDQYGLLFSYKSSDLKDLSTKTSIRTTQLPELLAQLLKGTSLEFEITDSKYVIIKAKNTPKPKQIYGQILDALSQEPLSFANVIIEGTSVGVSTDSLGQFELLYNFTSSDELSVSYIGYETLTIKYSAFSSKDYTPLSLSIREDLTPFLVIKDYITDGIDLEENGNATKINPSKVNGLPGQVDPNVLRTAQFLPGIAAPSSKASDLFIRGGTPDQNLILWEDIPIYHSAHYFGMISAFDPYILEEMKIYRGGFGAEYGGRVSGVIAMESGNEKSYGSKMGFGVNMTHAYLYGQQKIDAKEKTAVSFSVRRSYSELGTTPTMDNINRVNQQGLIIGSKEVDALPGNIEISNDISFIDTHFKISSQLTDSDRIEIASLYADNNFSDEIIDNNIKAVQRDSMVLHNKGLSLDYQHRWSAKWKSGLKLISTSYDYAYEYRLKQFDNQIPNINGVKENQINDNQFLATTKYTGPKNQLLELGYHLIQYNIDYRVEEKFRGVQRINEVDDGGQSNTRLHSLYLTYNNPISNKIGLNIGLRGSYQDLSKEYFFEPRINVAYKCSPSLSAIANYGRYHQFVGQVSQFRGSDSGLSLPLWAIAEKKSIFVQKGQLLQAGLIYSKNSWLVDLQFYIKKVNDLSSRAFDLAKLTDDNKSLRGSSRVKGIDLLVNKKLNKFTTWISYSYSVSELYFPQLMPTFFPSDYDQGHSLQASFQYRHNQFQLGVGYKISSGLPYTTAIGFRLESDMMPNPDFPQEFEITYSKNINDERLPHTQEVNFTVQYHMTPKHTKWQSYLSFSMTNVFNRYNIFNRTYYVDAPPQSMPNLESLDKINLLRTPNLSLRFEW